jgi:transcription termination factor Rho
MEELEKMSLVELRLYGRKLGMKNATTFKKKELIGEIQKILASGEAPEAEKTAKSSAKGSREKKSDTTEGKRTAKTTAKPAGRRTERRPARKNDYEDRGAAGSRAPRPVVRGGYTSNLQEMHNVREDRRYGSGRDNRYNRDERNNGREDRYSRDERSNGREERYSRDERNNGREDRYSRDENGNNQENYSTHDRNAAHDDSQHTGHVNMRGDAATMPFSELAQLDSGETKTGILEVMPEGYGFVRCDNYLPGEADVYVSPAMIRRFGLRTGDILVGNTRIKNQNEKFSALLYVNTVNGFSLEETAARAKFENLTPIFPNERIRLEVPGAGNSNISMRMMDLISPIGKGQRGMIVSQPKTGKTTLLKQVAKSVTHNHPNMHLIVLLIDERPEEVTDIKESIQGENVEVIYSTFDELPENHKRVSEMVIERAKRLVEHGGDVMILLDSITRLARAYNLTVQPSGRTLSGGLDPAALYMPKRFFGAARNMREGGSLTVLATALVDTGSKMDDVVFEEFKGTGNMEMVLDRSLSEKRLFPAIDLPRSSTRRDDLLLDQEELEANFLIRKAFGGSKSEEAVENIISMFRKTKDNKELIQLVKKVKIV